MKIWCILVEKGSIVNTGGDGLCGRGVCRAFGLRYAIVGIIKIASEDAGIV